MEGLLHNSLTDCKKLFAFFVVYPIIIVKLDLNFATSNSKGKSYREKTKTKCRFITVIVMTLEQ